MNYFIAVFLCELAIHFLDGDTRALGAKISLTEELVINSKTVNESTNLNKFSFSNLH